MSKLPFNPLKVPAQAVEHGGDEILRAVVANGGLFMSLKRGFDDPESWGRALAEVVKHISQIYANETKYTREMAANRIIETFAKEMASDAAAAGVATIDRR
jgi:hypothetical protein